MRKNEKNWAKNWDAVHDAGDRVLRADYKWVDSFHHRLLLRILEAVPTKKMLACVAEIEGRVMYQIEKEKAQKATADEAAKTFIEENGGLHNTIAMGNFDKGYSACSESEKQLIDREVKQRRSA